MHEEVNGILIVITFFIKKPGLPQKVKKMLPSNSGKIILSKKFYLRKYYENVYRITCIIYIYI